jgi:hypothetical protein
MPQRLSDETRDALRTLFEDGLPPRSVAATCRELGISRAEFYKLRRRWDENGAPGLQPRPPVHRSHPHTKPPELREGVIELALYRPTWVPRAISELLRSLGTPVSTNTVRGILKAEGLWKKEERFERLERQLLEGQLDQADPRVPLLECWNPRLRERGFCGQSPGAVLAQHPVHLAAGRHPLQLLLVIDTYDCHTFGTVCESGDAAAARRMLLTQVLPEYDRLHVGVSAIATTNAWGGIRQGEGPYAQYLEEMGIQHIHRTITAGMFARNGFIDAFLVDVGRRPVLPTRDGGKAIPRKRLQRDLDLWLKKYNDHHRCRHFPNFGETPQIRRNNWLNPPQP